MVVNIWRRGSVMIRFFISLFHRAHILLSFFLPFLHRANVLLSFFLPFFCFFLFFTPSPHTCSVNAARALVLVPLARLRRARVSSCKGPSKASGEAVQSASGSSPEGGLARALERACGFPRADMV